MQKIKAFAPASVANVSCGFDILGFPIAEIGDTLEVERTQSQKIEIAPIEGPGNLSTEPEKNVCGVVAMAMLKDLKSTDGLKLKLKKGILPGSGLGSSAASSAVTAYAINELYGKPFSLPQLVEYAMLGEALASGTPHADNVAPALYGGFVAVRSYTPLDIIQIPAPELLYCAVIHPMVEVRTELSRNILKKDVPLKTAIKQWGNVAGLIAGLYSQDYELIGRSLHDYIVEPVRSLLISGYPEITQAAKEAEALGGGISGSGPSIFTLCKGQESAQKVGKAMAEAAEKMQLPYELHVSPIAPKGCQTLSSN